MRPAEDVHYTTETVYSPPSRWIRYLLAKIGSLLPFVFLEKLDAVLNLLSVGNWMRQRKLRPVEWATGRPDVFRRLARMKKLDTKQVLYLEFGVYKGQSLQAWSSLLKNEKSQLFGFDTFEGLPEGWKMSMPEGAFSAGGIFPQIADQRVKYVKGRFKDTLPNFKLPPHEVLLINVDSDLYSSAWEIFSALDAEIKPGTLIYFDEIADRYNEMRAFNEYMDRGNSKYRLMVSDRCCYHMVFEKVT